MDEKYSDKWREWITIRTRNRTNMTANIFSAKHVNEVSRMIVDDVTEVAPVAKYEFQDSNYHTVRLLLNNPHYLESSFFLVANGAINYCRLPFSLTSMGTYGMRYLGSSQTCYIILKNPVPPTGSNSSTGMTSAQLYVPDESLAAYKTQFSNLGTRVMAMSTYTQRYY